MLIIQNIRTRKVYKKLNKTDGANQKSYSGKKIPPPPTENSLNWHTMSKLDVEQSKLNRVIKMVKENRSREEIKKAIDIEDEYLSILMQNYS